MNTIDWTALEMAARNAALSAYCPYSRYHVGAALLAADGTLVTGCNVENASYGVTLCAERVALVKAVSEDKRRFTALVIAAGVDAPATPCGACLQVLVEFCAPDMPICCVTLEAGRIQPLFFAFRELLPHAFKLEEKDLGVRC